MFASTTTEFQIVHLDLYRPDGGLWHITADRGIGQHPALSQSFEKMDLDGNVKISRAPVQHHHALNWHLNTILLTLTEKLAETSSPVTVYGPESTIHAIGLKANLETGDVEFLKQVQTQYDASGLHI